MNRREKTSGSTTGHTYPCPLCHSLLQPGEKLHTALISGNTPEKTAYIYGCPLCYSRQPQTTALVFDRKKRVCPVCGYTLKEQDYLIGRLQQKDVKTGLRILGCSHCHKRLKT